MKNDVLMTVTANEKYVVQFTKKAELTKDVYLTVPRQMVAIAYVDGKPLFKSNQCVDLNILKKVGKEYQGKEIQFAFYSPGYSPTINFGFGQINVNNERLKQAYRVGLHGQMMITFKDPVLLINHYAFSDNITVEEIREKILPTIKTVGIPILSSCFVNTMISVFEIDSMMGTIRENMSKAFVNERALEKLGIQIDSVAINQIYVNEDDLEMIRNNINL